MTSENLLRVGTSDCGLYWLPNRPLLAVVVKVWPGCCKIVWRDRNRIYVLYMIDTEYSISPAPFWLRNQNLLKQSHSSSGPWVKLISSQDMIQTFIVSAGGVVFESRTTKYMSF